jgi:two-component system sensor histidine kinase HydH
MNDCADIILEQSKRLDSLVMDTLSFARADRPFHPETIHLKQAMERALRLCRVQFGPSHAKVEVVWMTPPDDVTVMGNHQRIQQILINLILNAYQMMPDGGVLALSLMRQDGWALVRVADTGPGIRPEDAARVFEPFFTTKKNGSGLGLAISQKVAQEHGGKIEIECLEPRGAAFILRLPLDKKEAL